MVKIGQNWSNLVKIGKHSKHPPKHPSQTPPSYIQPIKPKSKKNILQIDRKPVTQLFRRLHPNYCRPNYCFLNLNFRNQNFHLNSQNRNSPIVHSILTNGHTLLWFLRKKLANFHHMWDLLELLKISPMPSEFFFFSAHPK